MDKQWNPNARRQREVDARADTGNNIAIGNSVTPDEASPKMPTGNTLKTTDSGLKVVSVPINQPVSRSQDS